MLAHRKWKGQAHRNVYKIVHGVELATEQLVCHTCDERRCWNPDHLFTGTAGDNNRDAGNKGRHHNSVKTHCPRGHEYSFENTTLKVTATTVMRECKECRSPSSALSKIQGTGQTTIPAQKGTAQRATGGCMTSAPVPSNHRVSAFTAAEWMSVGLVDKLVPLADYERLHAERDEYARCLDGGVDCAQEKLRLRAALATLLHNVETIGLNGVSVEHPHVRGVAMAREALAGAADETGDAHG
jgi:hypothetical protein